MLYGIPMAQRGVPQILVSFDLDANGILHVTAKDQGTGKENKIRIEGSSNLSTEEIERMRAEALANEESDRKEKENVDTLNQADSMIFSTEKQIKEFGEKLTEEDKVKLQEGVETLKKSHQEKNVEEVKEKMSKMNEIWNEISTKMYQQGDKEPVNEKVDDNVSDVDYEEVK